MKAPAFQFYASDFFVDTVFWSLEETGAYTRLLTLEWSNGPLPSEHKKLAQGIGLSGKNWQREWDRIWLTISSKFTQIGLIKVSEMSQENLKFISHLSLYDPSFLVNIRLEMTRGKQLNYSESRKKGAAAKWSKTDAHADAHADGMHMHNGCSPSSSPTPTLLKDKKNKKQKPIILSESQFGYFNLFYDAYPKHEGKEDAKKAWSEIDPEPNDIFLEKVLNTIRTFMPKWAEDEYKFVPLPATWIRAKRWNDEIVKPLNGNQDISQITRFAKGPAEWLRMRKQTRGEL